jgi:uroporphyrinogen decarboxylase
VPRALGQGLGYHGDGPVLDRIEETAGIIGLDGHRVFDALAPVFEAAQRVRAELPPETALIGFAGAPWTVATYMVEGGTSRDFRRTKSWAYRDPAGFGALIDLITEATIDFLRGQIAAGVDVVQLFDSWAGVLPESEFERWSIEPTKRIVAVLKQRFPTCPIIGFPRGAGLLYEHYAVATGVDAVSLDTSLPLGFARKRVQSKVAVQGNLDPLLLVVGRDPMIKAAKALRKNLAGGGFVFNLGHGVLPETPLEHVAALAQLLATPISSD